MEVLLVDDLETAIKNKYQGIQEYLNSFSKIWVTPIGVFSSLKQIELKTSLDRTTILRRFKSKLDKYQNWYVIDGNNELHSAEECLYCDELDDSLFYEDCWLCHVNHVHGEPFKDSDEFVYLYKGNSYTTTIEDWNLGHRVHNELGNNNDNCNN